MRRTIRHYRTVVRHVATAVALFAGACSFTWAQSQLPPLRLTRIATGFARPDALKVVPGDDSRFFVVEQGSATTPGRIRILRNGSVASTPFLTIDASTPGGFGASGNEQGLLGLAFHPQYASNRYFFVDYTDANGDTVVARYQTSATDPDVADPSSRKPILRIDKDFRNHNGGNVVFGPDGYLYLGTGDGGSANDACNRAETLNPTQLVFGDQSNGTSTVNCDPDANFTGLGANPNSLVLEGKLLRIDVDRTTPAGTPGYCGWDGSTEIPYAAPADNLFSLPSVPNSCREIWDYGLRNPWRYSFDSATGNLWVGDVGQNMYEEISAVPAGQGRRYFGWDSCEGLEPHETQGGDTCPSNLTVPAGVQVVAPQTEYLHVVESAYEPVPNQVPATRCSIAGGYVYRGPIAELRGVYLYGDYCSGEIFCAPTSGAAFVGAPAQCPSTTGLLEIPNNGTAATGLTSFGTDNAGNIYVLDRSGDIFLIDTPIAIPAFGGRGREALWVALAMLGMIAAWRRRTRTA